MNIDAPSLVEIKNLSFYRGNYCVFDDLNLKLRQGKITAILGPSGAGKTSLLHLIGRKLFPNQGEIHVMGHNLAQISNQELFDLRRKMGILFQNSALFTDLTIFDNVAFPLREHTQLDEALIRYLVLMKLEAVGLRGVIKSYPYQLSGGMQRRVALARAIALDPRLIMYDEPFTGQDPISKGILLKLIRQLNDALNMTTAIVSHDVRETLEIADYIYVIHNHKIIGEGTREQILNHPEPRIAQFIQGLPDGPLPFHYPNRDYWQDLTY